MNKKDFYNVLFNVDEGIAYQTDHGEYGTDSYYKTNKVVVNKEDQDEYNFDYQYYCINPLHPTVDHCHTEGETYKPRAKVCNVTSFRNFAIEFDEDTLENQKAKLKLAKPPVSAVVFSGSKSLHTPIALEDSVTEEEYHAIFEAIKETLLIYDLKLDKSCSNGNRLTRAPFQLRHDNQVEQKLLGMRGRIANQVLFDWFEANDINWKDYIYKAKESNVVYEGTGDADDNMRWSAALSSCKHFNGSYESSDQWQPWIFELGKWCKAYALSEGDALHRTQQTYSHPDKKAIPTGIANGYKFGNLTPRTLNKPKINPVADNTMFDNLLDAVAEPTLPYDFNIDNYAWIGSDIFLVMPDGELFKYDIKGFNARFKEQHLNANDIPNCRKYSAAGYYPDYFGDGSMKNNMYNVFRKPDVEIKEGDWSTTKILLEHIFGEQYELGLEYYWVKRHRPTQPLPAIGLVGSEDSGKSTIGKHQQMVFANMNKGYMHQLEKEENAFALNCQDIILEESNAAGTNRNTNPMIVVNKVKDMVTSTGSTIPSKQLYANAGEAPYYAKIMLFTNDMTPLQMDGEATRFWIRKIGIPEKYVGFMEKLAAEVGAFLYYLDNQYTPSRTASAERLWFHPDEYYTIAKGLAKDQSGGHLYKRCKQVLIDFFDDYPNESICYFDSKSMASSVCRIDEDTNCTGREVENVLINKLKFGTPSVNRKSLPDHLGLDPIKGKWGKRKMRYWAVNKDMGIIENTESNGSTIDLANAFNV